MKYRMQGLLEAESLIKSGWTEKRLASENFKIELGERENENLRVEVKIGFAAGYGVVKLDEEPVLVKEGAQIEILSDIRENLQISVFGDGICWFTVLELEEAEVEEQKWTNGEEQTEAVKFSDFIKDELSKDERELESEKLLKEAKANNPEPTFEDYKHSLRFVLTGFRGSKYIFKSLKSEFKDRQLSFALSKIERTYVNLIIAILGMMIAAAVAMRIFGQGAALFAVILWIIVDVLVIAPVIVMFFVPRPISKHIKHISEMTDEDRKFQFEEENYNERLEKFLRKYKDSGKKRYR